jgi:hypothetical protein
MRITARGGFVGLMLSCLLAVTSAAPAEAVLPTKKRTLVIRLAGAAGILSSLSCRNVNKADQAVEALKSVINELQAMRYIDFGSERRLRQSTIIPQIRRTRQKSNTRADCESAGAFVDSMR